MILLTNTECESDHVSKSNLQTTGIKGVLGRDLLTQRGYNQQNLDSG